MGEGVEAAAPPPGAGRPRIGVLTAYDAAQRDIAAVSVPNKRRYCARHGYEFIEQTDGFDPARVPAWGKVLFLKRHLPRFDWLFWSDADSLVMNGSVLLERFAADESGAGCDPCDVVVAVEDIGVGVSNVNAGQILVRNCQWSQRFLDEVWSQTQFLGDPLQEQRAIIHLLYKYDLGEHVRLVRQRSFNSYVANYRRGDFLLHFPDLPAEKRLRTMRYYEQFAEP